MPQDRSRAASSAAPHGCAARRARAPLAAAACRVRQQSAARAGDDDDSHSFIDKFMRYARAARSGGRPIRASTIASVRRWSCRRPAICRRRCSGSARRRRIGRRIRTSSDGAPRPKGDDKTGHPSAIGSPNRRGRCGRTNSIRGRRAAGVTDGRASASKSRWPIRTIRRQEEPVQLRSGSRRNSTRRSPASRRGNLTDPPPGI